MPGPSILCIDDYEPALNSLRLLLQQTGYEVVTAGDSAGVDSLAHQSFAAVVIDYHLPDSDGLTVARKLKQLNPGVPIVMLSGYAGDIPEQTAEWVDAFVAKGHRTAQELTATLARLVHRPAAAQGKGEIAHELKRAALEALQLDANTVNRFESQS